jgi:hypothetical protein
MLGGSIVDALGLQTIPHRILVRAASSLLLQKAEMDLLFPINGYENGAEFLHTLQGVCLYYKQCRSFAAVTTHGTLVKRLGADALPRWKHRNPYAGGGKKRKATPRRESAESEDGDDSEDGAGLRGIADSSLCEDSLSACSYHEVSSYPKSHS